MFPHYISCQRIYPSSQISGFQAFAPRVWSHHPLSLPCTMKHLERMWILMTVFLPAWEDGRGRGGCVHLNCPTLTSRNGQKIVHLCSTYNILYQSHPSKGYCAPLLPLQMLVPRYPTVYASTASLTSPNKDMNMYLIEHGCFTQVMCHNLLGESTWGVH